MALHLLQHDRAGAELLGRSLLEAVTRLGHCQSCNTFAEAETCELCQDDGRDASLLCVVETPADLMVMEQTQSFKGYYFVLMGRLSPLDGIGPKDIHLERLLSRAADPLVQEIVVATNFTPEGEATAHAIETLLKSHGLVPPRRVTRLARGVRWAASWNTLIWARLPRRFGTVVGWIRRWASSLRIIDKIPRSKIAAASAAGRGRVRFGRRHHV